MSGFGVDRGSNTTSTGSSDSAIGQSIIDAKGDLIAGTAADTAARLAVGTDGQRLVADSTALTGLKWVSDTTDYAVTTKGDIVAATANQTVARIAVGTDGQRLAADSAQTPGVKWVSDTQNTVIDAKGDLLAGTANDTLAKVTVGTDNQALIADSAQSTGVRWADVPTNTSPHRQTQLAGPVDSSGYNATLAAGAGLNFNVDATPTNAVYSFAGGFNTAGASDLVTVLTADASNQGSLNANNTHYIHATRSSSSAVTWSHAFVPPDYAYAFDRTRGALLNFEAADATTTMVDDFGNTWTAGGNAQIDTAQSKFGTASLLLDGTGDYITSSSYTTLGDGSWEMLLSFRLNAAPGVGNTFTLLDWRNAGGFGFAFNLNNTAGTIKTQLYLSSDAATWNVANGTLGANTTWTLNQWNRFRVVFDALAGTYKVYLSLNGAAETADTSVTSSARICAISLARVGADNVGAQGFNGWIDAFRFIRAATVTAAETPSVSAPTIADYPYHWFSIPEMKMYEVTSASASAGVNPGMTQRNRIFVGEADTGAATVSAVRNYMLRGQYISAPTTIVVNGAASFSHNLGVRPKNSKLYARNLTTDSGYVPGDEIEVSNMDNATNCVTISSDRNTVKVAQTAILAAANKSTGARAALTAASWNWVMEADRGF